jgi:hypothetical protein
VTKHEIVKTVLVVLGFIATYLLGHYEGYRRGKYGR